MLRTLSRFAPLLAALGGACGGNVVVDSGSSGAGAGTPGGSAFSCEYEEQGVHECVEYATLSATDVSAAQAACVSEMGTSGTGCPTSDALGSCAITAGPIALTQIYYSDGDIDAAAAQMLCTGTGGTWTAG